MKPKEVRDTPKKMSFKFPEGTKLEATVIKEVGELVETECYVYYYFVVQLIYHGDSDPCVGFGYYRRKPNGKKFIWGSQTTFHTEKDVTNILIKRATKAHKKIW